MKISSGKLVLFLVVILIASLNITGVWAQTETSSPTATSTETQTNTVEATFTATDGATATPSPTSTDSATATASQTATDGATATASQTATLGATVTASQTLTTAPSATASPTLTATTTSPSLAITAPINGTVINLGSSVGATGTHANLPAGTVIRVLAYINNNTTVIGEIIINPGVNGIWSANVPFNVLVAGGIPGTLQAIAQLGSGIITASNIVNVTWGQPSTAPLILINNPLLNAIVAINGTQIAANGFAANIPGTITVRAVDALGSILGQQIVTPNNMGAWQATFGLNVAVAVGARGGIIAFATHPNTGAFLTSARVDVIYGGQCLIRSDWFIYVVRSGDTLNRIASRTGSTTPQLAYANCIANADLVFVGQQLRVPNQPVITVTATTRPPTQRPATQTPPANVAIQITTPAQNANVSTTRPITVNGTGLGIAGQELIIRAFDNNSQLLGQTTARVATNNQWQAALGGIVIRQSTQGRIYAYLRSANGGILIDTFVPVVFQPTDVVTLPGATAIPGEDEQLLFITTPAEGYTISEAGDVLVAGGVKSGYSGEIFVRILDPLGDVLDEKIAQTQAVDGNGDILWQTTLTVNASAGTFGTVFAYVPSPFGLEPSLTDSVVVRFGVDTQTPYVTINSPAPYTILNIDAPITISGQGGRLFEGNVVVRVLDSDGNILAEDATIINAPDAGVGGEGSWQILLDVNAASGTRGSIIAFSTSANDGSIVAFASQNVILGDPTATANGVFIQTPLLGSIVREGDTLLIAGTADGSNGNTVRIQMTDEAGTVLINEERDVTLLANETFGTWQIAVELNNLVPGAFLTLSAQTTSRFDGTPLASDEIIIETAG